MVSGHISRVHLNFLSYSLQRLRRCPRVLLCQKLSQDDYARPTNSTFQLDYAYRINTTFAWLETIAPSWPKVVHPVANDKDDATRGLSIDHSWLHSSKTDDIMELLLFLMLQHRRKKPLPCHVIYMCNTNLIYREGGTLKHTNSSCINRKFNRINKCNSSI